jgi:hypothetical protein
MDRVNTALEIGRDRWQAMGALAKFDNDHEIVLRLDAVDAGEVERAAASVLGASAPHSSRRRLGHRLGLPAAWTSPPGIGSASVEL